MNFEGEFIKVCFQFSADFIQPYFFQFALWCCNKLIGSHDRALLPLYFSRFTSRIYMPVRFTLFDAHACTFYVHELKIKLMRSKFECCPVSSCSRSWYRGTVTSSFPASQASCRVSFPPCCSHAEVARILLTLISPICAWKGKTYRHRKL